MILLKKLNFSVIRSSEDVEDLLAERGVIVSHEAVRQWMDEFGGYSANSRPWPETRIIEHIEN